MNPNEASSSGGGEDGASRSSSSTPRRNSRRPKCPFPHFSFPFSSALSLFFLGDSHWVVLGMPLGIVVLSCVKGPSLFLEFFFVVLLLFTDIVMRCVKKLLLKGSLSLLEFFLRNYVCCCEFCVRKSSREF